jgi:hypothetical protein
MVDPLALRRFEILFGERRTGLNGIRRTFFESVLSDVQECQN